MGPGHARSWTTFGLATMAATAACAVTAYIAAAHVDLFYGSYRPGPLYGWVLPAALCPQFVGIPLAWLATAHRDPKMLAASKVLAAVLTVTLTLLWLYEIEPSTSFGAAIEALFAQACAVIGLLVYGSAGMSAVRGIPDRTRKPIYLAAVTAMLGGFYGGTFVWSEMLPERIAAAAIEAAAGRPFCMMPGPDRDLLKGRRFLAQGTAERADYHVKMIVDDGGRDAYRNWSFRAGTFVPTAKFDVGYYQSPKHCRPVERGGLDWAYPRSAKAR